MGAASGRQAGSARPLDRKSIVPAQPCCSPTTDAVATRWRSHRCTRTGCDERSRRRGAVGREDLSERHAGAAAGRPDGAAKASSSRCSGPSGCGKSTLLKMVAGLLEPSDGRLLLWRKPVEQIDSTGHRLSFVFQEPTLMPWARVQANVRLPLDLAGVPRGRGRRRACTTRWRWSAWTSSPATCRASCRAACRCACRSRAGW